MTEHMGDRLLQMRGTCKAFSSVQALDDVALEVASGEVVGLVGENGAGKSTLVKILSGCHRPDAGEIVFAGRRLEALTPQQAYALGIGVIYQEFNLAPPLSVAENVYVGRQPRTRLGTVAFGPMHAAAQALLDSLGLTLDARRMVRSLSVAEQQMVEIAKAVSRDARLIIMDEPTAALTEHETSMLLDLVRRLKRQGVAVLYISHRLEEVLGVADRVVVLRDGRNAGHLSIADATVEKIVRLMVGRELNELYRHDAAAPGAPALEVHGLARAASGLRDVDVAVNAGEIVGMAGLVGAGRTEIARAVFGVDRPDAGRIRIAGHNVRLGSPRAAIRAGLGFVPENRKEQGLFLVMAVRENVAAAGLSRLSRWGFIRPAAERRMVGTLVEELRIRAPSQEQPVQDLSGGNQQKVVLARWLALRPRVLIMDEPTRGIDVGAKTEVYRLMGTLARQGVGILMVSSELPEVLGMSDRVLVVRDGTIAGQLLRTAATQEAVMHLATGGR